jgi:ABC-type lipoprotein export system ATPase subunit
MLSTHNVSFAFDSAEGASLKFPDFTCQTGEHWLLLGQSGSGKTTLLHLLAGLRTPQSGEIRVNDTILNQLSGAKLDQFRGKEIGVIFQQSHFLRALTVGENLALARQLVALPPDTNKIKGLLEQLNIAHKSNALPSELSVGEQQRVAIARALVNDPTVILADEPTSALDDKNTEQVVALLKAQAQAANATLLVVTHDNRLKNIFDQQIEL